MQKTTSKFNQGFSFVGLLATVGTLVILFTVVTPPLSKFKERQVLNNATQEAVSAIMEAKSQTLASSDSSSYGVYFEDQKVTIFKGQVYSASSPDNIDIELISPASISEVSLGGTTSSSGELYFERLSGAPSKTGSITINVNDNIRVISVNATGAVETN